MRKPRARKLPESEVVPINIPRRSSSFIPGLPQRFSRLPALYPEDAPITEERLINAMKTLAYIITSRPDGEVLSPLFERLECELADLRNAGHL